MAGNLESNLKAVHWEAGRDLPNINHLNGEGRWSVPPRHRVRIRVRRVPRIIPYFSINRGPPKTTANILKTMAGIALVVLVVSIILLPLTLYSFEKINSPENAEQVVTDKEGYKHWKIEDVWYTNKPLDEYFDNRDNIFSTSSIDTSDFDFWDVRMNPFSQPNDSNMVWYGSGDVDSNNVRDWNDYDLIQQGIQNDQADIDGDGNSGTQADAELFAKYLNSDTLLPQVSWAWQDYSSENKINWLNKMFAIDKTSEIPYVPGSWMCGDFAEQTRINFQGNGEVMQDSSFFNLINPGGRYDFSNNGRFNLPVFQVRIRGPPHHAINACLIGDNPLNWDDWYFIEPQNDKQVIIGDWNMSDSSNVEIYHSFFYYYEPDDKFYFAQGPFIEFQLTKGVPELVKYEDRLILQRPYVNSVEQEKPSLLEKYVLNQNYPNPFNSQTTIKYSIPLEDKVKLQVYDVQGKLVQTLVNKKQKAGEYFIDLNSQELSSGIYLYRMETSAGLSSARKMIIMK